MRTKTTLAVRLVTRVTRVDSPKTLFEVNSVDFRDVCALFILLDYSDPNIFLLFTFYFSVTADSTLSQ